MHVILLRNDTRNDRSALTKQHIFDFLDDEAERKNGKFSFDGESTVSPVLLTRLKRRKQCHRWQTPLMVNR